MSNFADAFTSVLAMLLCLTFHEAAHAYVARLLGDRTAELQGRLSLNPFVHADPLGTIILPAIGALFHMPILGWAKPVPVDSRNLRNPRRDYMFVAMAGPASNLLLAGIFIFCLNLYEVRLSDVITQTHFLYPLVKLLGAAVYINVFLAIFNLIPLPPLDGATVLMWFLPDDWARKYQEVVAPYGFFILLFLLMGGGLAWIKPVAMTYVSVVYSITSRILG